MNDLDHYACMCNGLSISLHTILDMEFAIPITKFDPTCVKWGEPRSSPFRRTIPFTYHESKTTFNNLLIGLQPLRIVEIDWTRNQVVLEEYTNQPLLKKLEDFQTIVSNELDKQSKSWSDNYKSHAAGTVSLQPWLKSHRLTLYLSSEPENLSFFINGHPDVFSTKTIQPGDILRVVLKIQGISLQMSDNDLWTGKSRIQHHILQLYKVD